MDDCAVHRLVQTAASELGIDGLALRFRVGRWRVRGWIAGTSLPDDRQRANLAALALDRGWMLTTEPFGAAPEPLDYRVPRVPREIRMRAYARENPMIAAKLAARGIALLPVDPLPDTPAHRVQLARLWRGQVRDAVRYLAERYRYEHIAAAVGVRPKTVSSWVVGKHRPYPGREAILMLWARHAGCQVPPIRLRPIRSAANRERFVFRLPPSSEVFLGRVSDIVPDRDLAARLAKHRRSIERLSLTLSE